MIRLATFLFALLLSASAHSAEEWATAVASNERSSSPTVYRYIKDLRADLDIASQPVRVIMSWRYSGTVPNAKQREQMDQLEAGLKPLVESGKATLVIVASGDGQRDWTYYAQSQADFMEALKLAIHGQRKLPIRTHIGEDPLWDTYKSFVESVRVQ